jgi:hypothetical protein
MGTFDAMERGVFLRWDDCNFDAGRWALLMQWKEMGNFEMGL